LHFGKVSLVLKTFAGDLAVNIVLKLVLKHEARLLVSHFADLAQQRLHSILSHTVAFFEEVGADVFELGGAIFLQMQVLDQLCLDATLIPIRRLNTTRRTILIRLVIT
jgi:hypothetical protein